MIPHLQVALAKLSLALISFQIAYAAIVPATITVQPISAVAPISAPERLSPAQIYEKAPILKVIAACESTGSPTGVPRQFLPSGAPLWGNNPTTGLPEKKDVGELQIDFRHFSAAQALGLDVINSEEDNVYYGYLLYLKLGTEPWAASRQCWQSSE